MGNFPNIIVCFFKFQKVIEDVPALTDAVRAQMIEVLGRVSKEADEIFSKQRAQNDETKKSN